MEYLIAFTWKYLPFSMIYKQLLQSQPQALPPFPCIIYHSHPYSWTSICTCFFNIPKTCYRVLAKTIPSFGKTNPSNFFYLFNCDLFFTYPLSPSQESLLLHLNLSFFLSVLIDFYRLIFCSFKGFLYSESPHYL
jgi:hypothetical protein